MTVDEIRDICSGKFPDLVVQVSIVDPRRGRIRVDFRDGTFQTSIEVRVAGTPTIGNGTLK